MVQTQQASAFIANNFNSMVRDLVEFIHFPSIGGDPAHTDDVLQCATWLATHLRKLGMEHVQFIRTEKHPIVYADWMHAPGQPTLLIYGHYDVQPVDPIKEWHHDPFKAFVNNGYLYGRGSSDDKGQLFAHVKALEYFLREHGRLPVNIKCVFEGEEEIGSDGLKNTIKQSPDRFKADVCVVSDMAIPSPEEPAITYSLRGVLSVEISLTGQQSDLHSGTFGGSVYNPLQALCEILASLHDSDGKITIAGFYDDVKIRSLQERKYLRAHGRTDKTIQSEAGSTCSWGEKGFSVNERITLRPSLSINGITGGYQGEGPKAVIPSSASAKVSIRLASGQDPARVEKLLRNHIQSVTPACIKITIRTVATAKPVVIKPDHPYIQSAKGAFERAFKRKAKLVGSGGTIPIVNVLYEELGMPVVMMGFALPDDNPHGPNEKFLLQNFNRGIATSIYFMEALRQSQRTYAHH